MFKGTSRRTAEADRARNGLGRRPCSTRSPPRRSVCFNAKVLHEHLPLAFDVISDLVLRPLFAEEDIVKENQVILEEIRMEEDNPESVAHELLTQNFWRGHPLGAPILGTRATVRRFTRDAPWSIVSDQWYAPETPSSPPRVASRCRTCSISAHRALWPRASRAAAPRAFQPRAPATAARALLATRNKPALEQAHITMAVPSLSPGRSAPLRHVAAEQHSRRRHVLAPVSEHPRAARPGLRRLQRADPLLPTRACSRSMRAPRGTTVERVLRSVADEFAA